MTITADNLLKAGYSRYENSAGHGDWNRWLFQKRVRDEQGTRYFVDVQEYDWSGYPQRTGDRCTYEASVRYYAGDGLPTFVMTCQDHAAMASVETLEAFFSWAWMRLELGHYEFEM
jgi:hypothetical protein